jgi:hypothetical protein
MGCLEKLLRPINFCHKATWNKRIEESHRLRPLRCWERVGLHAFGGMVFVFVGMETHPHVIEPIHHGHILRLRDGLRYKLQMQRKTSPRHQFI